MPSSNSRSSVKRQSLRLQNQFKTSKHRLTEVDWNNLNPFVFERVVASSGLSKKNTLMLLRLIILNDVNVDVVTAFRDGGKILMNKGLCKLQEQTRLIARYTEKARTIKMTAVEFSVPVITPRVRYEDTLSIPDLVREAELTQARLRQVCLDVECYHLRYIDRLMDRLQLNVAFLEDGSDDVRLIDETYQLFVEFLSYEKGVSSRAPTPIYREVVDLRDSGELWELLEDFMACCLFQLLSEKSHHQCKADAYIDYKQNNPRLLKNEIYDLIHCIGSELDLTVESMARHYWVVIYQFEGLQAAVDQSDCCLNKQALLRELDVFNWIPWLQWVMVTSFQQKISEQGQALRVPAADVAPNSALVSEVSLSSSSSLSSLSSLSSFSSLSWPSAGSPLQSRDLADDATGGGLSCW